MSSILIDIYSGCTHCTEWSSKSRGTFTPGASVKRKCDPRKKSWLVKMNVVFNVSFWLNGLLPKEGTLSILSCCRFWSHMRWKVNCNHRVKLRSWRVVCGELGLVCRVVERMGWVEGAHAMVGSSNRRSPYSLSTHSTGVLCFGYWYPVGFKSKSLMDLGAFFVL